MSNMYARKYLPIPIHSLSHTFGKVRVEPRYGKLRKICAAARLSQHRVPCQRLAVKRKKPTAASAINSLMSMTFDL